MSEPTTEAGRRLLADGGRHGIIPQDILAIEQEARADLAARIVAAVEGLPRHSPDDRPVVRLAAILRAIREASDEPTR